MDNHQGLAKVGTPFANAGSQYPRFPIALQIQMM
jgi:hypothetical protein